MPTISGTVYDDAGAPAAGRIVRVYRRDTGALLGGVVTSDGVTPIILDPHYASVSLLLHCDGEGNSTVFADSSAAPKEVAAYGNAKISTAQSKWGIASGYFPGGSSDYAVVPSSPDFAFGTSDFTIECWVYIPSGISGSYAAICDIRSTPTSGGAVLFKLNAARQLGYYHSSQINTTSAVPLADWTHISLSRASGVSRLFVGGVLGASASDGDDKVASNCYIGRVFDNGHPAFSGYIADLRITKGVARYTADFTPPTAPYPNSVDGTPGPAGSYGITTAYTGEVQRIVLDDDAGTLYNDLIDRVMLA